MQQYDYNVPESTVHFQERGYQTSRSSHSSADPCPLHEILINRELVALPRKDKHKPFLFELGGLIPGSRGRDRGRGRAAMAIIDSGGLILDLG